MAEFRHREKGFELQQRREWERLRWQTWQLMMPNFKRGSAPRTAKAFCPFPWEKSEKEEVLDMWERSKVQQWEADALNVIFENLHNKTTS